MKLYLVALTIFSGIGGFLFGYDTGVISGAMPYINRPEDQGGFDLQDNDLLQEAVVSSAILGAAVGSLLSYIVNDFFGRKKAILFACSIFTVGALVMGFAPNVWILIVGRVLVGLGVGFASMSVPIYIAESAPENLRGALVSIDVLLITTGQFVSYCTDAVLIPHWRWMLGLSCVPAILQFIGMLFLPESPRWLLSRYIKKDKTNYLEKATNCLEKLRNDDFDVSNEVKDIIDEIEAENKNNSAFKTFVELITVSPLRHALIIGVMMQIFQQICGINTVMYYSSTILVKAGFGTEDDPADAIYGSIPIGFTNMIMSVVAVLLIDRAGRRPLLMFSLTGVMFSLSALAISFIVQDSNTTVGGWMALISLVMYLVFFAPGMGPVPWALNSEIYPLHVRSMGSSIATSANWISNLVISATFLTLVNYIEAYGAFFLYSFISFVCLIFVFFLVPETKGYRLEQIQELFEREWIVKNKFEFIYFWRYFKKSTTSTSTESLT